MMYHVFLNFINLGIQRYLHPDLNFLSLKHFSSTMLAFSEAMSLYCVRGYWLPEMAMSINDMRCIHKKINVDVTSRMSVSSLYIFFGKL